jgi:hypothetical protein
MLRDGRPTLLEPSVLRQRSTRSSERSVESRRISRFRSPPGSSDGGAIALPHTPTRRGLTAPEVS